MAEIDATSTVMLSQTEIDKLIQKMQEEKEKES